MKGVVTGVSIIVPVYNALEDAQKCVERIYTSRTAIDFEVIVVDNGSRSDVAGWLAEQTQRRPTLKALHFDEPLGFARAVNEGVRHSRGDLVALLNSDTLVTDGWLDCLAGVLMKDPGLGIVSPVTNRCGHDLQRDAAAQVLQPEESQRYAESIRDRRHVAPEAQRLMFFCVLLRRTLWDLLAGLDEIFGTGNFEDDDFCLRTRLAGFRMAVANDAFVFHSERRTFDANRLNHGEALASNQAVFGARASRWSRTLRPLPAVTALADSISVIVPTLAARAAGLRDSLTSLANQTVRGFEVVVVSPTGLDVSQVVNEFFGRLRLKALSVDCDERQGPAALLHTGLAAAAGSEVAYLPAADIYYPFHLEVLSVALAGGDAEAVFSAWNVVVSGKGEERRGPVVFPEAEPGIELGDWAPLLCWLHRRSATSAFTFDWSFGAFAPWAFVLQLRKRDMSRYLSRVTCERTPDGRADGDAADAERVMQRFPVANTWQQSQRQQFLEGIRLGNWEDRLILERNDRARRARSLLARPASLRADPKELAKVRVRLEDATACIEPNWREPAKPDVFLFSIIEWTALMQRPQHFALGLAARGHRVFWVDVRLRPPDQVSPGTLLRELSPGLYLMELPAVQGEISRLEWRPEVLDTMMVCMVHVRAAMGISTALQLVNFPRWEPLVTRLRRTFRWPVVYDCLDDQRAFAELYGTELGKSEEILMQTSSHVFVSGRALLKAVQAIRPDVALIPNGADFELFHGAQPAGLLDHLPRPIVGFFGAFADWLDFDWIEAAARRFPGWSFVYIGREGFAKPAARLRWKSMAGLANVHIFPQATPDRLAHYLAQMDVCTMPFQDLPATRSMNAVKIYEYLAAGKPVVAANLPETEPLRSAGLIATYRTCEESFALLEEAVREPADEVAVAARVNFAAKNTWAHRLDELSSALGLVKDRPQS